jgi:hypothetical protein
MADGELPPKGRSRPLGSRRSGDTEEMSEGARDLDSRTRLLGTFSVAANVAREGKIDSARPTVEPNRQSHGAYVPGWQRTGALLTSACVLVGLGFALGSFLPQKKDASRTAGTPESALKIGFAAVDGAYPRAAGTQAAPSPTCTASSPFKLAVANAKKTTALPSARVDAQQRLDPQPRADSPAHADSAKSYLSPVRDPGF